MFVYMAITKDKYELPIAVADSCNELARILGIKPNHISSSMSKARKKGYKSRYIKVEI